ncbi:MAG: N-6 DNA methylase [Candidatus Coatesbacteria bacterium]|nr:MAG: N-6 DNA methylase [Candidatus Coatesbacteria bacterium]
MAAADVNKALRRYVKAINKELATGGRPSEQTYYPALRDLIDGCGDGINAHIVERGAAAKPDVQVYRRENLIGVVEAKDLPVNLGEIEANAAAARTDHNAEQFRTYLAEYDNLLYTNYVEWRLYRRHDPAPEQIAVLGHIGADGKFHTTKEGREAFENVVGAFLAALPEPHATAKGLAPDMARLTKVLDARTRKALDEGNEFLKRLYDAFQDELIHGLKADEFADMYAQTIAYGLFTARIIHARDTDGPGFDRFAAERLLPVTNPFLKRVFGSLVNDMDMPKRVVGIVEDLAALIGAADMGAISEELARFGAGRRKGEEVAEHDPVIYFYEHFLRVYDPEKAKKRGVYYTPLPVVRYIVRSIDELLKNEFDLADGLADQSVIILDPACGTGTFLYEVVRLIHERLGPRGAAEWNEYVPTLLERLFGFELLMAPYTIAHLKLAELLRETGYEFRRDQRLGIYLTNTLEEAEQHVEQKMLPGIMGAISREKEGADRVKAEAPVMVVLGNPPYAGHSANKGPWIDGLLKKGYDLPDDGRRPGYYEVDGEPLRERNPKWLQDDYVKFLRWAQWRIDRTGRGVVGMITNHGYLDNPTFRGMRQNLMGTFDTLYLLDLHGNAKKKETCPDGSKDENVFDIMQGVAIFLGVKS